MLKLAGYLNIIIGIAHVIGLIWAEAMFEVTGIGPFMEQLTGIHPSIPYLITIIVAIVFVVFGLYALSLIGAFRPLPYARTIVLLIGLIYIARSLKLVADRVNEINTPLQDLYSIIALLIGVMIILGYRKTNHSN